MLTRYTVDEVWVKMLRQCLDSPSIEGRSGGYRELIGTHSVMQGSQVNFLLNTRRALSPIYASAELLWYLSRKKSAELLMAYAPQYKKYINPDGTAYGAYGSRLARNLIETCDSESWNWLHKGSSSFDMLNEAIELLKERPTAKQCVISLWKPMDLVMARTTQKDIPCTLTWHFLLRDNKLHMLVNMRSNDLWLGFLYDVYVNSTIQKMVAAELGVEPGEYHHSAGSMHLYERNVKAAIEATKSPFLLMETKYVEEHYCCGHEDIDLALSVEAHLRNKDTSRYNLWELPRVLHDSVVCCLAQHAELDYRELDCPVLQRGMQLYLERKNR